MDGFSIFKIPNNIRIKLRRKIFKRRMILKYANTVINPNYYGRITISTDGAITKHS